MKELRTGHLLIGTAFRFDGPTPMLIETLRNFIESPRGEHLAMAIPDWIASAIGAKGRVVVFSADSMVKNKREHPEMAAEEYALLPCLNGDSPDALVIQDRPNACVIIQEHGRRYLVALKATQSGESIFLTSFHQMKDRRDIERKLRRGHLLVPPFK